ncbi:amino acid kinase family protein [Bremerella alba]|uniref:Aspartate/glutamate/uridylate kinase domain-containing protein n=1 Tax=Bremerella alba TaxID=980252 RepID=A0A7V9A6Y5_9BACT|nr:hypothetical protein [Bremerella alba]MBA2114860.1 hypothetical protein [Bremerella alba]
MGFAVWKLGGSLLDLPDLAERINQLHAEQSPALPVVIIPGGGVFADAVRTMDQRHDLKPLHSNHLALQSMQISADLTAMLLVNLTAMVGSDWHEKMLRTWKKESRPSSIQVWNVIPTWYERNRELEKRFGETPVDWSFTSDSLAAIFAAHWGADCFTLIKSVDRPGNASWEECAQLGIVDGYFPTIASHLNRIEWVNLRAQ